MYHRKMESRPLDPTVLHGQGTHMSSLAWRGVDSKELHYQHREMIFNHTSILDERIIPLLQQAGFYGVARLGFISLDWHLIYLSRVYSRLIPSTYLRGSVRLHYRTLPFFLDY